MKKKTMAKNSSLYKVGDVLQIQKLHPETFFGFPTELNMVDGFDTDKVYKVSGKWGTHKGILNAINNIEEYKQDVEGLLPHEIIEKINKNAIFSGSGFGRIYVYPINQIEISNVILGGNDGRHNFYHYDFLVQGVKVCSIDELTIQRMLISNKK